MRSLIIISLFILGFSQQTLAQTGFFCGYNPVNERDPFKENLCQFFGALPDQEATKVVEAILGKIGVKNSIKIVPCLKIKNCYAWFYNDPKHPGQYILYDPTFLEKVKNTSAADWGAKCVLAHEVAHILFGHTFESQGSNPDFELAADKWSGYALYKLGAPEKSILDGVINYAEDKPSVTHPPRSERQKAIILGYKEAQQEYHATTSQLSSNTMEQARKKYESAIATPDLHARLVKLSEAISLNPKYSDAYYARADTYNNIDSTDAALREVNKAIEFNVDDANHYYLKSEILKKKGQSPAAIRSIQTAISINPGLMQYRVMHANLRINNQEFEQCAQICNEILQSDKGNEDAYYYRGKSFHALSNFREAVDDFSKAISLNPTYFLYYKSRGESYSQMGNYMAALADCKKSLALNHTDAGTKKMIDFINKKLSAELTKPRGYVTEIHMAPNITKSKKYGMEITSDFTVHNMKGIEGKAIAYFYYEDGTPLLTDAIAYQTARGELSSSVDFRAGYNPAEFKALSIFLPYNILILPQGEGTVRLKYQVCIFSYKDNIPVELCRSEFKAFSLNIQYK